VDFNRTLPIAVRAKQLLSRHDYFREGARTYLAAWDVRCTKAFGRFEVKNGISPMERLVGEVMSQEPTCLLDASGLWTTAPLIGARKLTLITFGSSQLA
jgi:hypothetical protein